MKKGFTIVELLIVIVVIGILAAITIVAFNGVQNKANVAVLQSDLTNASKKIKADNVLLGTFPDSLSVANEGKGISVSAGTTLAYTNTATSFCLTGVRGSATYHMGSSETLSSGGCPITNLIDNPSVESNTNSWTAHTSYTVTRTQANSQWVYTVTRNATGAAAVYIDKNTPVPTIPNAPYTASAWVTTSVPMSLSMIIRSDSSNTNVVTGSTIVVPANTPTRLIASGSVGNISSAHVLVYSGDGASGDVLTIDKVMLTQGTTTYTYADGASDGWSWNGTVNNSSSTGPAQL